MASLDAVDQLLLAEVGEDAERVVVVDAPALACRLSELTRVIAWCDDARKYASLPGPIALGGRPAPTAGEPGHDAGFPLTPEDLSHAPTLYRLPKSLGELDEVAAAVSRAGGWLFGGAKIKHLNHAMNSVLGRHFDAVNASLGVRKARVLRGFGANPRPAEWPKKRHHPDLELWVSAHGATFGGNKIDPGTRLLADHLGQVAGQRVVDLGCGNGTLAALLARAGRSVRATDSSWAAVSATRETARLNGLDVEVAWADGLSGEPDASAEAIVSNPPFHQGRAKESGPTLAMFADAARVLVPGGEFWCVFNSHLPWKRELGRVLGPTKVVAQNTKYTLTRSVAG
ncbi:MAG: methyltransferase [Propionibacteriaceae bacterium]|nr:methyltransferase [Propionibacteriaceae bacterium]